MINDRFAARINAFAAARSTTADVGTENPVFSMLERAAKTIGLTDVDLNYPDHFKGNNRELFSKVADLGLNINGLAMRYGSVEEFKLGAFTNPEPKIRQHAIDLTKQGIDAARTAGASLMTIWLGQDGFDYSFQADYRRLWEDEVEALREVALHDPECIVSLEYKPNEPRAFSVLPNLATTLHAITDAGCANLGVTLDFAHMLYANENPAASVRMAHEKSKIAGVHLNDGYSKRDDGLMVATVHLQATVEFLLELSMCSYDGVIYFDTFPDASGLDPVLECEMNIRTTRELIEAAKLLLDSKKLESARARQDAISAQEEFKHAFAAAARSEFTKT